MNIYPINLKFKQKTVLKENNIKNIEKKECINTKLENFPNYSYLINFGSNNENLENFYNAYSDGKGMAASFEKFLSKMTPDERREKKDIYSVYRGVYSKMEDIHSVDDLKKYYPEEFSEIESTKTVKSKDKTFLSKIRGWAELFSLDGQYLFPKTKDDDLTVYLARKIYFEVKTKKEIEEDFRKDINPLINDEDFENLKTEYGKVKEIIPSSVYEKLGLTGDINANGYRNSLCLSREEYIKKYGSIYTAKRREHFEKILKEVVKTEDTQEISLPKRKTANYEKLQYIMFYAWNNSVDLRRAMSDFLIEKKESSDMLTPDIMEINANKEKNDYCKNLHNLMKEFWNKFPEYKEYFSEKCKEAFDVIEFTIDNGTFDILKKDIEEKRLQIYVQLKSEKEKKEKELKEQEELKIRQQIYERRKENLRKNVYSALVQIREEKPIPSSYNSEMARKSFELTKSCTMENEHLEEIRKEVERTLNYTNAKANAALLKTAAEIITILEKDKKENKEGNYKLEKKILKMYEDFYGKERIKDVINTILMDDIQRTLSVFGKIILPKYIMFLQKFPNAEAPREGRKKVINEYLNKIKTHSKIACFFDRPEKIVIFDEMAKRLFETSPQKVMTSYQKNFKSAEVLPENIEEKYHFCWHQPK